jgi:putative oxidoreductase
MATTTVATPLTERLVYSRPDPASLEVPTIGRPGSALAARILLGSIFLLSGAMKFINYDKTLGHMTDAGIPHPEIMLPLAALAEVLGAVSIISGLWTRLGALGLFVFMIPTTVIFHGFWRFPEPEASAQMINFMKNLTIMGGLLALVSFGAGRYSIDAKLRQPIAP